MLEPIDFVILIALEEEAVAFRDIFEDDFDNWQGEYPARLTITRQDGSCLTGLVNCFKEQTSGPAQRATERILRDYDVALIVSIGISGRLNSDVALCDVVASTVINNYMYRSRTSPKDTSTDSEIEQARRTSAFGGKVSWGGKSVDCERDVVKAIESINQSTWDSTSREEINETLSADLIDWLHREELLLPRSAKLHTGLSLCGPTLIASDGARKELLKQNRLALSVDMESFGIADAVASTPRSRRPAFLCLRGVSDPSNEKKKKIDDESGGVLRRQACLNASRLLRVLLKEHWPPLSGNQNPDPLRVYIDTTISKKSVIDCYLSQKLDIDALSDHLDTLWNCLISTDSAEKSVREQLESWMEDVNDLDPRYVIGEAGAGKSSFLSTVYLWQAARFHADNGSGYWPVLLDLHKYLRSDVSVNDAQSNRSKRESTEQVRDHLDYLQSLAEHKSSPPLLILLDGADDLVAQLLRTMQSLRPIIQSQRNKLILSHRQDQILIPEFLGLRKNPTHSFALKSIAPNKIKEVASHVIHNSSQQAVDKALEGLAVFDAKTTDLFTLAQSIQYAQTRADNIPVSLGDVYEWYCRRRLLDPMRYEISADTALNTAATEAFDSLRQGSMFLKQRVANAQSTFDAERLFLFSHTRIREYLVARHVFRLYREGSTPSAEATDVPRVIFPYTTNRFMKHLLLKNPDAEDQILQFIERIIANNRLDEYIHPCYMAGRMQSPQNRQHATKLLDSALMSVASKMHKAEVNDGDTTYLLLLRRTIIISLVYLGSTARKLEYVRSLLGSKDEDDLNRGFHLEYYGDIEYYPLQAPVSRDTLRPAPQAFRRLSSRLTTTKPNPLADIELHTLCSLAQHRHAAGELDRTCAEHLANVINHVLSNTDVRPSELYQYANMVQEHLADPFYSPLTLADEVLNLKKVLRAGWKKHSVENPESVADHTFGAVTLAMLFLPNRNDKQHIINMLIVHDWAEAVTGDLLPGEEPPPGKPDESEVFERWRAAETYLPIHGIGYATQLWNEYHANTTDSARIAHDLDILESLMQCWRYRLDIGPSFDKALQEFKDTAKQKIRTNEGEAIRDLIGEHFYRKSQNTEW